MFWCRDQVFSGLIGRRQGLPRDAEARGWFEVLETERPIDTDSGTHISDIQMVDGIPTRVWIYRDWTPEETAARNAPTLEDELHAIVAAIAAVEGVTIA